MQSHIESAAKHQEPSIVKLTSNYNSLCHQISKLIATGCTPATAIASQIIVHEGLFKLDINDDISKDVRLEDDDYQSIPVHWLSNDKVCQGIAALLKTDCCVEESRLGKERCALQEWFSEEWLCVEIVKDETCELALDLENVLTDLREFSEQTNHTLSA